jgi:putative ABC transport system substrate-binding protein
VRRREFITLFGGAAAWPVAARAQQPAVPAIGVLNSTSLAGRAHLLSAFQRGVNELGYIEGRNVAIEYRWAQDQYDRLPDLAADLVRRVAVIAAHDTPSALAAKAATTTIPIVFATGGDPVKLGLVASLNRPGGNATGFSALEYSFGGKLLELLKQISPRVTRVAVIRDPSLPSGSGQFGAAQAVGPFLGVEVSAIDARDPGEIERAVSAFAQTPNGGLIAPASTPVIVHRELIIGLAAKHRLSAVYPFRIFAADGGLASYGADSIEPYRQAAVYVDRILKGERPADLPVQAPTKYQLLINLKTAKALGLDIPATVLARADEVIE